MTLVWRFLDWPRLLQCSSPGNRSAAAMFKSWQACSSCQGSSMRYAYLRVQARMVFCGRKVLSCTAVCHSINSTHASLYCLVLLSLCV